MAFSTVIVFENMPELIHWVDSFSEKLIEEVIPMTLTEIANRAWDFLQNREHWISGTMKSETWVEPVSKEQVDVGVAVPYAHIENERKGVKPPPHEGGGMGVHNFWETSIADTIMIVPDVVNSNLSTLENIS